MTPTAADQCCTRTQLPSIQWDSGAATNTSRSCRDRCIEELAATAHGALSGAATNTDREKEIRRSSPDLRIHRSMKRPYRFIISFDVFISSAVFLKAGELDFSMVFEARQGISES